MGSPSELSLDYKLPNSTHTTAVTLKALLGDQLPDLQATKIEEFLSRLEEERLKIDAFKRELPLCMQLLNNAMEAYKQQLEAQNTDKGQRPVLEEFLPLKQTETDGVEKPSSAASEKATWMTSAQLWTHQQVTDPIMSPKLAQRVNGGAFLPFSKGAANKGGGVGGGGGGSSSCTLTTRPLPELTFSPAPEKETKDKKCLPAPEGCTNRSGSAAAVPEQAGKGGGGSPQEAQAGATAVAGGQNANRKARRCWSPDLHRRFVSALQMLGGSQVATPKQIRELMKVDGLTNDEVKSHLQKYRLHTRRPIPALHGAAAAAGPQLVVLGGIWVPPEYAASAAAAGTTTIYGAHPHAAAHYCAATPVVHPEFYHRHHHLPPPALHHRGVITTYRGAQPEQNRRSSGEKSESIENGEERGVEGEEGEEGRSESTSWKGGDEKALVPVVRDDGPDDSNGSDVTLKF